MAHTALESSDSIGARTPGAVSASRRPVVLLHGFASTPTTLALLAGHVRRQLKRPVLRPSLGFGWGDLPRAARLVADAIVAAGCDEVDVVGHSLGGLVATELLKNIDRGARVRRVITLGTPHAGVPLARFAAIATLGLSPSMRQLVPGSRFLARLAARPVPRGSELVAISGDADSLVPEHSSWLAIAPRQCSLRLRDMGHVELVFHRDALQLVGDLLEAPNAAAPSLRLPAHRTRHANGRAAALAVGQRALS